MANEHHLSCASVHYAWDNALPARLVVEPGDVVVATTRDSSDHYYSADSSHEDVARKGPLQGHPLTGPIAVRGAEPDDTLVIEIVDVTPSARFGWTAIRPGKGLLPSAEFPSHFLQIWDLSDSGFARMRQRNDIAVPITPFPGIVGTALIEPGSHSTIPPRANGGNMDLKYLTRGARLYLPVSVPQALFRASVKGGADALDPIHRAMITVCERRAPGHRLVPLPGDVLYDRIKAAHTIVATSEPSLYGNMIIRKGVIYPERDEAT